VYVAAAGPPATLFVIDTASHEVVASVPIRPAPVGVTVTLTHIFVLDVDDGTVTPIDRATNAAGTAIPVGCNPLGIAASPDGMHVYATECGGPAGPCTCPVGGNGNLQVIDTATNTVADTIPVGIFPRGVAVSPDGTHAYVANLCTAAAPGCAPGSVSVIDTAQNAVVTTVPAGPAPASIDLVPDGSRAYITNAVEVGPGAVTVLDTATNTTSSIPLGNFPYGLAVTPDGAHVYVAVRDDDNVSVIATSSDTVVDTVPVGDMPQAVGEFIAPARTGLVPPDKPTLMCEAAITKRVIRFLDATLRCHIKAARKTFNGKPFDEPACKASARAKLDAALAAVPGCPACAPAGGAGVADVFASLTRRASAQLFCAGAETF
jgi:YVTN family beta-propeller protein